MAAKPSLEDGNGNGTGNGNGNGNACRNPNAKGKHMGNDVAVNAARGALADVKALRTAVAKTSGSIDRVGRDPFLKMGKDGVWAFGQNNLEVQEGSIWAIDPTSFKTGYICWTDYESLGLRKKNDKKGSVFVPLGSDPIEVDDLPEHRDADSGTLWEWKEARQVTLVCTNGEDKGTQVVYQTNSFGGVDLLNQYLDDLMGQLENNPDEPVMLVKLGHRTYNHSQWGKTYTPEIETVGWRAMDDASPVEDAAKEEAPRKKAAEYEAEEQALASSEARTEAMLRANDEKHAEKRADKAAREAEDGDAPAPTRRRRRPAA